jgi:5-methylcytosine-specific restriction endonuclease McrA
MSRAEFSVKTKEAAHKRAAGFCECGCKRPFGNHPRERPEYDHIVLAAHDGGNDLDNCAVLRYDCHKIKTLKDQKPLSKARRGERQRQGLVSKKSSFRTSRSGPFKAKIGGGIEPRG